MLMVGGSSPPSSSLPSSSLLLAAGGGAAGCGVGGDGVGASSSEPASSEPASVDGLAAASSSSSSAEAVANVVEVATHAGAALGTAAVLLVQLVLLLFGGGVSGLCLQRGQARCRCCMEAEVNQRSMHCWWKTCSHLRGPRGRGRMAMPLQREQTSTDRETSMEQGVVVRGAGDVAHGSERTLSPGCSSLRHSAHSSPSSACSPSPRVEVGRACSAFIIVISVVSA